MNKNMPFCLLAYGGTIFLFMCSQQWFFMWLVMELSTISFVGLFFYKKTSTENITLYFLVQSVAAFFILINLLMTPTSSLVSFQPEILFIFSIFLKLGVFPFHNWVVAVTTPLKKNMVLLILLIQKIIPFFWLLVNSTTNLLMWVGLALLNLLCVSPQNLFQTSMKMVLVVSSISHSSWMLLAISSKFLWETYFFIYTVIMACVLMLWNESLKNMFQKNDRTPLFLIFLTLGGVPPLMGFYPKFFLVAEILQMKMLLFVGGFLLVSLVDLIVYSRLSMSSIMKNKMSLKWQKFNESMVWLIMANVIILSSLFVL